MQISIIMPLYNAEKFLKESIESIINQTYRDFELLCINDGSDDLTVSIINEYISIDSRIKLVNNEKRFGAAYSRNRGIEEAKGDYIIFLDGDDIFDEEMLELAYGKAVMNGADVVMFEYMHVPSEKINVKRKIYHSSGYINRFCHNSYTAYDVLPCEFCTWSSSPCNKLFSRKFIVDKDLHFQTLKNSNDVYFVEMAYMLADKLIQLDDTRVMVYARDHITPTRISVDRDPMCAFNALIAIREELIRRKLWEKAKKYYWCKAFALLLSAIDKTNKNEKAKEFYLFLQREGMDRIINLAERNSSNLDRVLLQGISDFLSKTYEERIYYDNYNFRIYLEYNKDRIITLLKKYEKNNQKIGVWGMGKHGIQFMAFCRDYNLSINCLIDEDKSKQESGIAGYSIVSPNHIEAGLSLILVTPKGIFDQVIKFMSKENTSVKIIDLCSYLYFI